jgi:hypothetical protein
MAPTVSGYIGTSRCDDKGKYFYLCSSGMIQNVDWSFKEKPT